MQLWVPMSGVTSIWIGHPFLSAQKEPSNIGLSVSELRCELASHGICHARHCSKKNAQM